MNKKVKWGIIIVIAAGLTGLGIHSLLPHENKELTQVGPKAGGSQRNRALSVNAEIIKEAPMTDGISLTGLLDAEKRILSAEYDTKMCEISLLQLSGGITTYLQ